MAAVYSSIESQGQRLSQPRTGTLLERVIWAGLLLLLPLAAIPHGAVEQWWEAAVECYTFALGALWIVNGFLRGTWPLKHRSMLLPLLALVGYAYLQTIPFWKGGVASALGSNLWQPMSADPASTRHFAFELLALIIFAELLLGALTRRRQLSWLIWTVIGVGAGSALFGLGRVIALRAAPELMIVDLSSATGYGQFLNPNHFALLIEMVLGLELGLVLSGVRRPHLFLHLGLIFVLATSVVLTNSRGGIFSMLSQIVFVALIFAIRRLWRQSSETMEEKDARPGASSVR